MVPSRQPGEDYYPFRFYSEVSPSSVCDSLSEVEYQEDCLENGVDGHVHLDLAVRHVLLESEGVHNGVVGKGFSDKSKDSLVTTTRSEGECQSYGRHQDTEGVRRFRWYR